MATSNEVELSKENRHLRRRIAELEGEMDQFRLHLSNLEDLYRTAPVGLALIDTNLRFVRINERLAAINGPPAEDHIGNRLRDMIPQVADTIEPIYRRVIETDTPALNFEVVTKTPADDMPARYYVASYYPVKDSQGVVIGVSTVVQDVTDRRRTEEALKDAHDELEQRVMQRTAALAHSEMALRASKERFDLAVRGATDGLWDRNVLSGEEWWSDRFYKLLGYEENDIESNYESFVGLLHSEDREPTLQALRAHLEHRQRYDIEIRLRAKSGEYRWFRTRGQALWDETGRPTRMAGSIQDIADRKHAEKELADVASKLALPSRPLDPNRISFPVGRFSLSDMNQCGAAIRAMSIDAKSKRDVAEKVVRFLYDALVDDEGQRVLALARCFETCEYVELDDELKAVANSLSPLVAADSKYMKLIASSGDRETWNDPRKSVGHRIIRLPSADSVRQMPMISQLIRELGFEIEGVLDRGEDLFLDDVITKVFHVAEAVGSPHIPAQEEFVIPLGLRSVVGFGDLLPNGNLFVIIMFSKVPISRDVAGLFSHLALSLRIALLPFVSTKDAIETQLFAIDRLLRNQEGIVERQESQLLSEQKLLRKLLDLQERDRRILSLDVHDGIVQDVVGAHLQIESIRGAMDTDMIQRTLGPVTSQLEKAIAEGRRLIRELRPIEIEEFGLIEAITNLIADERDLVGLQVTLRHDVQFDRLDPMLEGTLYRIVQEALNNVKHHGKTDKAEVRLTQANESLDVIIRDDGVGFDLQQVSLEHFGLRGIRERARLFGGSAIIESAIGKGTLVHVQLPIFDR